MAWGSRTGDYQLWQHCFPTEGLLSFNLPTPTARMCQAWEQQCHCSTAYTSLLNLTGLLIPTHHQQFVRSKAARGQTAVDGLQCPREHFRTGGWLGWGLPPSVCVMLNSKSFRFILKCSEWMAESPYSLINDIVCLLQNEFIIKHEHESIRIWVKEST